MRGKFVVIEGSDCSGKGTVIEGLKSLYPNALFVCDPGSTSLGQKIREILKHGKDMTICGESELLLFTAVRSQLVHEKIILALSMGQDVFCDRFILSTLIYQTIKTPNIRDRIFELHEKFCDNIYPDVCIVLDIDYDTYKKRREDSGISSEEDRFESDAGLMMNVIERYRHSTGIGIVHINGSESKENVLKEVKEAIDRYEAPYRFER